MNVCGRPDAWGSTRPESLRVGEYPEIQVLVGTQQFMIAEYPKSKLGRKIYIVRRPECHRFSTSANQHLRVPLAHSYESYRLDNRTAC